jgi:hypothetical protein
MAGGADDASPAWRGSGPGCHGVVHVVIESSYDGGGASSGTSGPSSSSCFDMTIRSLLLMLDVWAMLGDGLEN